MTNDMYRISHMRKGTGFVCSDSRCRKLDLKQRKTYTSDSEIRHRWLGISRVLV